jgi:hypothetical protein
LLRGRDVLRYETLDGILAHASAARAGEDRLVGFRRTLAQPCFQNLRNIVAQGRAAELSPLALAADVGAGAKRHVLAAERGQLGDAQTGLDSDEEESVVAPSDPSGKVWSVEKDIDFLLSKELHDPSLEAFARDGEDPLAEERMGWIRESDIAEESVERCKAGVAAASGVAALALEVVEELAEECGVEV